MQQLRMPSQGTAVTPLRAPGPSRGRSLPLSAPATNLSHKRSPRPRHRRGSSIAGNPGTSTEGSRGSGTGSSGGESRGKSRGDSRGRRLVCRGAATGTGAGTETVQRLAGIRTLGTRMSPPLVVDPRAYALVPPSTPPQTTSDTALPSTEAPLSPSDSAGSPNTEAPLGPLDTEETPNSTAPLDPLSSEDLLYLASTRFLDDFIAAELADPTKEIRQVVLLASGDALDATRPFRLPLPRLCAVFDVSPAGPYEWSSARLKEAGVGMPPGTLLRHVSADICEGEDWRDEGWGEKLVRMGYRGDRPSIWVLQDCGSMSSQGLIGVLGHARGLAKSGSSLIGEIGASIAVAAGNGAAASGPVETVVQQAEVEARVTSLFAAHGFRIVQFLAPRDVLRAALGGESGSPEGEQGPREPRILFHALQQRLSDIELENAEVEISRAMLEGDEEGFEED